MRQGDVFGFMVEHHAKQGQYRPALALLQVMVSPEHRGVYIRAAN